MLTPQELLEIADTMQPHLDEINAWITKDLISRLMARIADGKFFLSATDEWQIEAYKAAGGHYEELQKEIKRFTKKTDAEVKAIFEDAGLRSWESDDEFYTSQGYESIPLRRSESALRVLEDTYQRTNGEIHNFTRTTAKASQQRFIKLLDAAHIKVMSGTTSYTQAVKEAVEDIAGTQTKVYYPSGHIDTIETAILRAVRTGTAQASGNLALQGMIEHDWDLIRVSAHIGARYGDGGENPKNHFWWQGKLYSRTGKTYGYPLFVESTGYGTGDGLCGWNCRHSFGPGDPEHNPFKDFDAEENKRVYDLSQRQRAQEAAIRKERIKAVGLKEAVDKAPNDEIRTALQGDFEKSVRRLHKMNENYNKFCEDNSLKRLADRLNVAKWNREMSKAASAVKVDKILERDIIKKGTANNSNELIPNAITASTPQSKIQGYLLNSNHPVGKEKARVFNSVLGYHYENWNKFSDQVFDKLQTSGVSAVINTQHGIKYTVPMRLHGETGKSMVANTVWQIDKGSNIPRLITITFDKRTIRKEE